MPSILCIGGDELLGRCDLPTQRSFLNGGDHDVRRQREISGLDREALRIGKRLLRLHRSSIEPPDVERVGDKELRGIEVENLRAADAGMGISDAGVCWRVGLKLACASGKYLPCCA